MSVYPQKAVPALARSRPTIGTLLKAGLLGGTLAALANLALYAVARALLVVPFLVPDMADPTRLMSLPVPAIVLASLIPGLLAALFLWLLGRFVARPVPLFQGISVVLLLLSLVPPMTMATDLATRVALSVMHVLAAVAIVGALSRAAPDTGAAESPARSDTE